MLNIPSLDRDREGIVPVDEKELLTFGAENVRTFYALTGPARKEYIIQMAEADAERVRILRKAQAEGLLAIRKAEAEGLRLIGEALAQCEQRELVAKMAGLMALQQVAQSLGDGKATKLFLPQSLGDIFSLVGGWQEVLRSAPASAAGPTAGEPTASPA
jgi:hypothetical protein